VDCRIGIDNVVVDADGRFVEKGDDLKCNKDSNLGSDEDLEEKKVARDGYLRAV
jgi:hypothetical protein